MGSIMIYYITRVRVGRRAVFTLELTAVCSVDSVEVGHCWGSEWVETDVTWGSPYKSPCELGALQGLRSNG